MREIYARMAELEREGRRFAVCTVVRTVLGRTIADVTQVTPFRSESLGKFGPSIGWSDQAHNTAAPLPGY